MITKDQIFDKYFTWLVKQVTTKGYVSKRTAYSQVLKKLYSTPFSWIIEKDENRAADGLDLRHDFAEEDGHSLHIIDLYLDGHCSILEMMVALARRCEIHIMSDDSVGDRTSLWFWTMIDNLGLGDFTNQEYDETLINAILSRFLERRYKRNGEGGLFVLNGKNMKDAEIWYQANWYFSNVLGI